jgi:hypothetical protein
VLPALSIRLHWLDHSNYTSTWQRVQVKKLFVMETIQLLTVVLFRPNINLSTLFSNTPSLYSSLNIKHHVSPTYQTRGKIRVSLIKFLSFLGKSKVKLSP